MLTEFLLPRALFGAEWVLWLLFALSVVILIFQRTLRIWDISWRPLRTSSPLRGPATHTRQPAGLGLADIDRALRDSNLSAERRAELTTLLAARLDEARS